eukprot:g7617.t1
MSYNIPGQDPGPQGTEPPSTPCTGDFFDKLHCRENGWFLWVGAFCVLVVVCGCCSCYVVTPLSEWLQSWLGVDDSKQTVVVAPADSYKEANSQKKAVRRKSSLKPARSKSLHREHSHHWYLDDALKITQEDEMELGRRPPAHTVPTARRASWAPRSHGHHHHDDDEFSTAPKSKKKRRSSMSSMSSNRASSSRPTLNPPSRERTIKTDERASASNYARYSRRLPAALVVDDPGIGAEATLRGGGWMGAENGRL